MKKSTKVVIGVITGLSAVAAFVAMKLPFVDVFKRDDIYDEYEEPDDFDEPDINDADEIERTLQIAEEAKKFGEASKVQDSEADAVVKELNASMEQTEGLRDELHVEVDDFDEEYRKRLEGTRQMLTNRLEAVKAQLEAIDSELAELDK